MLSSTELTGILRGFVLFPLYYWEVNLFLPIAILKKEFQTATFGAEILGQDNYLVPSLIILLFSTWSYKWSMGFFILLKPGCCHHRKLQFKATGSNPIQWLKGTNVSKRIHAHKIKFYSSLCWGARNLLEIWHWYNFLYICMLKSNFFSLREEFYYIYVPLEMELISVNILNHSCTLSFRKSLEENCKC